MRILIRILESFVTACLSAGFCLVFAVLYLMGLGLERRGNYEYYGNYPWLYLGPAVVALFVPRLLARLLRRWMDTDEARQSAVKWVAEREGQ